MKKKHLLPVVIIFTVLVFLVPFLPIRQLDKHPAVAGIDELTPTSSEDVSDEARVEPPEERLEMSSATRAALDKVETSAADRQIIIEIKLGDIESEREDLIWRLGLIEKMLTVREDDPPPPPTSWRDNSETVKSYEQLLAEDPEIAERYAATQDKLDEIRADHDAADLKIDMEIYDGRDRMEARLKELDAEEAALRAELGQ